MSNNIKKKISEFRKDFVSQDWIIIAPGRLSRPHFGEDENKKNKKEIINEKEISGCPFEDPQKSGNPSPILWYPRPNTPPKDIKNLSSWFVQVFPNKYPLVSLPFGKCPTVQSFGPQEILKGVGFHEVIITRDHFKTIDKMTLDEVELLLRAYQTRYRALASEPCVNYILILHNQGKLAGASISHPHSQLVALPIVDPDISRSLSGSQEYFKKNKKCIHCEMIDWELRKKERIIYKNKHFVTIVSFAPRVSYEVRIYPIEHASRFEEISDEKRYAFADSFRDALKRIVKVLKNPDYNFFIHTAPLSTKSDIDYSHYHWHLEILPHVSTWAGLELGMGIEVVVFPPEEAARNLRKAIKI